MVCFTPETVELAALDTISVAFEDNRLNLASPSWLGTHTRKLLETQGRVLPYAPVSVGYLVEYSVGYLVGGD